MSSNPTSFRLSQLVPQQSPWDGVLPTRATLLVPCGLHPVFTSKRREQCRCDALHARTRVCFSRGVLRQRHVRRVDRYGLGEFQTGGHFRYLTPGSSGLIWLYISLSLRFHVRREWIRGKGCYVLIAWNFMIKLRSSDSPMEAPLLHSLAAIFRDFGKSVENLTKHAQSSFRNLNVASPEISCLSSYGVHFHAAGRLLPE
jgi:hypothetical protein